MVHVLKKFLIQGNPPQFLNWEEYGLRITILQGTMSPTETNEIAVTALVGGQFQLPEGTELVSAIYANLSLNHYSNQSN